MRLSLIDPVSSANLIQLQDDHELQIFQKLSESDPSFVIQIIKSAAKSYQDIKNGIAKDLKEDMDINPRTFATHVLKADKTLMIINEDQSQLIYIDGKWKECQIPLDLIEDYPYIYIDLYKPNMEDCYVDRQCYKKYEAMLQIPGMNETHLNALYVHFMNENCMHQSSFSKIAYNELKAIDALLFVRRQRGLS